MKKKILVTFLVFAIALIAFNIFTTKINFTDVTQYLNVGKEFAEIATSKVRNTPGLTYGMLVGQALKIIPHILTAKLFNVLWLFLDGVLLYYITKRWRTLLLWMFSPIVWYMGSWISPLLPISFLFLITYYNIKQFEKTNKYRYLILSGLCLGLASTLWWAAVYISIFFVVSYLLLKKLITTAIFGISWALTFSIRILLDQYLYNMPFYSSLRGLGSNVLYGLGHAGIETGITAKLLQILLLLVIISPFLFRLYKVNPITNFKDLFFLLLISILFIANLQIRYFLVIAPILIMLLAPVLSKKEFKFHILISLVIIAFLVTPYFGATQDYLISQDLKKLETDFPGETFIAGSENTAAGYASLFSSLYWGDSIKEFVEYEEYVLGITE
ncbi:MAG: hypothetical protein Q8R00_02125, partial [Candidatus Nanoarchaeia archaeon]|nr:hypothetical protein [Candidatus Nanoarchaeia archaeon]